MMKEYPNMAHQAPFECVLGCAPLHSSLTCPSVSKWNPWNSPITQKKYSISISRISNTGMTVLSTLVSIPHIYQGQIGICASLLVLYAYHASSDMLSRILVWSGNLLQKTQLTSNSSSVSLHYPHSPEIQTISPSRCSNSMYIAEIEVGSLSMRCMTCFEWKITNGNGKLPYVTRDKVSNF